MKSNVLLPLLLLVAVVAGSMLLSRASRAPHRAPAEPAPVFFSNLAPGDIDRISIESSGQSLILSRAEGGWSVEGRRGVFADTTKVAGALREAARLSRGDLASAVAGKDTLFGLGEEQGTRVSLGASGVAVAEFVFGSRGPGGAGTYARPAGGSSVYLVRSSLAAVFPLDPSEWRDRRPLRFPIEQSRRLLIERGGSATELAVLGDGRWHMVRPWARQADTRKVERVLVRLAALSARAFGDDETPASCGLAGRPGPGTSVVTVGLLDGGSVSILFGARRDGLRCAMTPGRDTIYEVPAEMVDEILLGPEGFLP